MFKRRGCWWGKRILPPKSPLYTTPSLRSSLLPPKTFPPMFFLTSLAICPRLHKLNCSKSTWSSVFWNWKFQSRSTPKAPRAWGYLLRAWPVATPASDLQRQGFKNLCPALDQLKHYLAISFIDSDINYQSAFAASRSLSGSLLRQRMLSSLRLKLQVRRYKKGEKT